MIGSNEKLLQDADSLYDRIIRSGGYFKFSSACPPPSIQDLVTVIGSLSSALREADEWISVYKAGYEAGKSDKS